MTSIREAIRKRFAPAQPLDPGVYHYQSPPYAEHQYRMHLRVESSGEGILLLNAATVLHLNQTATEYAYHFIKNTPDDEAIQMIKRRYDISAERIKEDYQDFKNRILQLIDMPDLDPVQFLDFERETPYTGEISAPYRLDCALTYRLPAGVDQEFAPTKRVDRELTTDEWTLIIDKAWKAGIPHIVFTGGEPTLREDLSALIVRAEQNGQVTGLLTDGRRLAESGYLNEMLQSGLDHLMVMLEPEDEHVWDALGLIFPEDIFTTVHISITSEDSHLASGNIKRLADLGANAISLTNTGPELDEELLEARELVASLEVPLVWDLPVPYSARNPVALETKEGDYADGAGKAWLYVEPDGDVLPAQGINEILGNLLKDDWKTIWNS